MPNSRPLHIPVILGSSPSQGAEAHVARFVHQALKGRHGVRTELLHRTGLEHLPSHPDAVVLVRDAVDGGDDDLHPATGVVAVSVRATGGPEVETSLAALRELDLVTLFWDINASLGGTLAGDDGGFREVGVARGTDKFLDEVVRMARTRRPAPRPLPLAGSSRPTQD